MVIKNRKGETTSYPNWAIIEPNRKYLDSHSILYIIKFLVFIGNIGEDAGK